MINMLITDLEINRQITNAYLTLRPDYEPILCVYEHKNLEIDFYDERRPVAPRYFEGVNYYNLSKYDRIYEHPFEDFFKMLVK